MKNEINKILFEISKQRLLDELFRKNEAIKIFTNQIYEHKNGFGNIFFEDIDASINKELAETKELSKEIELFLSADKEELEIEIGSYHLTWLYKGKKLKTKLPSNIWFIKNELEALNEM